MIPSLSIQNVYKSYGQNPVISDLSLSFSSPGIYCLMAPSGAGKTTLFRLILGLEIPDRGTITITPNPCRISAVFQEDRLIEHMTPLENAALVLPGKPAPSHLREEFCRILPDECLDRPVSTLSGGMRRRCAFLRSLLAPSDLVIMDEPFTGLDEGTKNEAIRYFLEKINGRLALISTHNREDALRLGAGIYSMDSLNT